MNNRNLNKENTYSNLSAWCAKYHKDSGIKIHPSSVPVDLVLEDVMGWIGLLMAHDKTNVLLLDQMNKRVEDLEKQMHELTVAFVHLEAKLGETTLKNAEEIQKEWAEENKKPTKKVKK